MIEFRIANTNDIPAIMELVVSTGVLDLHTPYTYWVIVTQGVVMVGIEDDQLAGFVSGMRRNDSVGGYFLWQIGVAPNRQGQGIGAQLLTQFLSLIRKGGGCFFETTIASDNIASVSLFQKLNGKDFEVVRLPFETGTLGGAMKSESIYRVTMR